MLKAAIAKPGSALTSGVNLGAVSAWDAFAGDTFHLQEPKEDKMRPISKTFTAAAATLLTFAFFGMSAPAAYADDYCITNGAQAAHGCGYPSMETCRAASAGIGGTCSLAASSSNPSNSLAYQPKQTHSRSELRKGERVGH